jgi:hypothetical protein
MIKSDVFTSTTAPDSWLSPDSINTGSEINEKESGGIALSNPSLGIAGYTWSCQYTALTGSITLINETTAVSSTILNGIFNLATLSFAFDANMRPAIGYTLLDGTSYLYYYDSLTESYSTLTLPAGSYSLRLTHDDKRYEMVVLNVTDILVFYVRGSTVYYRLQRERYQTEHQIATVTPGTRLRKAGMTTGLQICIGIADGLFISSP